MLRSGGLSTFPSVSVLLTPTVTEGLRAAGHSGTSGQGVVATGGERTFSFTSHSGRWSAGLAFALLVTLPFPFPFPFRRVPLPLPLPFLASACFSRFLFVHLFSL